MFERLSQRGSFTEEEARNIVKQVGQGLKHMHDNHIIHRDLKVSFLFFLSSFSIDRLVTISLSFSPFLLPHLAWEYTLYRSQWFRDNKNLWFWYGQNCWTESCSHSMWNRYPCHFLNKFSFFFFFFLQVKTILNFLLLNYVAPEVFNTSAGVENPGYGKKVDIWSLGVILYILYSFHLYYHFRPVAHLLFILYFSSFLFFYLRLSGRPPFYDDSTNGVLLKIKRGEYGFPPIEWDYISKEGE